MQKKPIALVVAILLLSMGAWGSFNLLRPTKATHLLDMGIMCGGTVDKTPGESFTVKIHFRNTGTIRDVWRIAVTFESNNWAWKSDERSLELESGEKKKLIWEGRVPGDADLDSMGRLIVYYDDEFIALNWWIHVTGYSELCVVSSNVY